MGHHLNWPAREGELGCSHSHRLFGQSTLGNTLSNLPLFGGSNLLRGDAPQEKQLVPVPMAKSGSGCCIGCSDCIGGTMVPQEQLLGKLKERNKKMYDHVYAHEQAHAAAAGEFNQGIEMGSQDPQTGAIQGVTHIAKVALDANHPERALRNAQVGQKAAMAPSDPSSQDYRVAAMFSSLEGQADAALGKKQARLLNEPESGC